MEVSVGEVPGDESVLARKGWGGGAGRTGLCGPSGRSGAKLGLLPDH